MAPGLPPGGPPAPPVAGAAPTRGLWAAAATLMAGGAAAQALPLLLGPWLARLYTPAEWGAYALFAAVAAMLAVVACARYDFALPLARDDGEARDLLALALRIAVAVVALCAAGVAVAVLVAPAALPGGASLWAWLPVAVAAAAAVQALSLWMARAQRFGPLAVSRFVQHGGGALAQGGLGWAAGPGNLGGAGLAAGATLAAVAACAGLLRPSPPGGWRGLLAVPRDRLAAVARRHRDFPLLNTPHAFLGTLQDAAAVALVVGFTGDAAAGWWALALRYLKAPATLVGGSVSQALYPKLAAAGAAEGLRLVRRTVLALAAIGVALAAVVALAGPAAFRWAFGADWAPAGDLSRALAVYVAAHFVASPLGVVTLAWRAQGWALRVALAGQVLFVVALAAGLAAGGLLGGAWAVSAAMGVFYAGYAAWLASGRLRAPTENRGDPA